MYFGKTFCSTCSVIANGLGKRYRREKSNFNNAGLSPLSVRVAVRACCSISLLDNCGDIYNNIILKLRQVFIMIRDKYSTIENS